VSTISTHVLDAVRGKPAEGVPVILAMQRDGLWDPVGRGTTGTNGRCEDLVGDAAAGVYRLTFLVEAYFTQHDRRSIYPEIAITFHCDGAGHYHLPLLLSDNSYTTYRGS
jgi:5-hydroxyisourate hydrolase